MGHVDTIKYEITRVVIKLIIENHDRVEITLYKTPMRDKPLQTRQRQDTSKDETLTYSREKFKQMVSPVFRTFRCFKKRNKICRKLWNGYSV